MIESRRVIPCMREWADKAFASVWAKEPAAKNRPKKIPLVWTDATEEEKKLIQAIAGIRFLPATFDKRFARKIQAYEKLTAGQREQLARIAIRYRRQLPNSIVLIARKLSEGMTNGKPTDQH